MTGATARWTPWLLAAMVAAAYVVVGPRGGAGEGALWRDLVAAVGDGRALGAVVLAVATVIAGAVLLALPPGPPLPTPQLGAAAIASALGAGAIAWFAYGADFPDSRRSYSHLT